MKSERKCFRQIELFVGLVALTPLRQRCVNYIKKKITKSEIKPYAPHASSVSCSSTQNKEWIICCPAFFCLFVCLYLFCFVLSFKGVAMPSQEKRHGLLLPALLVVPAVVLFCTHTLWTFKYLLLSTVIPLCMWTISIHALAVDNHIFLSTCVVVKSKH